MSERAGQPTSYRYSPGWRLFTRIILHPMLRLLMRNRWAGKENIPKTGGIILAPNHLSYADWGTIALFSDSYAHRYPVFMIKSPVFGVKFIGALAPAPLVTLTGLTRGPLWLPGVVNVMLLSLPTPKHGPGPGAEHGDIVTAPNVSDVALPNPFPKRLTLVPPFASPWFGSIAWMTGTVAVSKVNFVAALVALVLAPTSTVTSTVELAGPGGAGLTKRSVSPPGKKQPPGVDGPHGGIDVVPILTAVAPVSELPWM